MKPAHLGDEVPEVSHWISHGGARGRQVRQLIALFPLPSICVPAAGTSALPAEQLPPCVVPAAGGRPHPVGRAGGDPSSPA